MPDQASNPRDYNHAGPSSTCNFGPVAVYSAIAGSSVPYMVQNRKGG